MSLELFMDRFVDSEFSPFKHDTNRDFVRGKKSIQKALLLEQLEQYWGNFTPIAKNDCNNQKPFVNASGDLSQQAITLFEQKCGENVVVHNGKSFAAGVPAILLGAFATAATTIFALEFFGISVLPLMVGLLPVLGVLGPIGGILAVAAAVAVAALVIYGAVVGATAALTKKDVKVIGETYSRSEEPREESSVEHSSSMRFPLQPRVTPAATIGKPTTPVKRPVADTAALDVNEENPTAATKEEPSAAPTMTSQP